MITVKKPHAKTGWKVRRVWCVVWVEWSSWPVFFALNINTHDGMKDLYKRQAIVRDILKSIEALPNSS
ncbi:MAG: hypothetical protein MJK15_03740 [Colwellia sp.]|nr:hypothetical protein [Colwellia sp.]